MAEAAGGVSLAVDHWAISAAVKSWGHIVELCFRRLAARDQPAAYLGQGDANQPAAPFPHASGQSQQRAKAIK